MSNFTKQYLEETNKIIESIDQNEIDKVINILKSVQENKSRLFLIGLGGSYGHCSHATVDFKKICNIDTYSPGDNIPFMTAIANDEGLNNIFSSWFKTVNLTDQDVIMVISVGGGSIEKNVSNSLVKAIDYVKSYNCKVIGLVGKDGGYTKNNSDACIVIPPLFDDKITPHTEGITSVLLHLIVSHPELKVNQTKWESVK